MGQVVEKIIRFKRDIDEFATLPIEPDQSIYWRLFHLGVFGELLVALRNIGCTVISKGPIRAAHSSPVYSVTDRMNREWDLWFEATQSGERQGLTSPYIQAMKGLQGNAKRLELNILLHLPGKIALILECKYSDNRFYIGNDGYFQAVAYAAEIKHRLNVDVFAIIIGPEGIVDDYSYGKTAVGNVGVAPPSAVPAIVEELILASISIKNSETS